jgi:hypothetical protein
MRVENWILMIQVILQMPEGLIGGEQGRGFVGLWFRLDGPAE